MRSTFFAPCATELAGVAAIEIEDNAVPRLFGSGMESRHSELVPLDEHVGKLRAAVAARRDPSTVIIARTSAFAELPLDAALERLAAYSQTGAEALMMPSVPGGRAHIEAMRSVTSLPVCILGLSNELLADTEFLVRNKVRIRFIRQLPYGMAVKAIFDALTHLRNGGTPEEMSALQAPASLLRAVDRTEELKRWQNEYVVQSPPHA